MDPLCAPVYLDLTEMDGTAQLRPLDCNCLVMTLRSVSLLVFAFLFVCLFNLCIPSWFVCLFFLIK